VLLDRILRFPDSIAVRDDEKQLSFSELCLQASYGANCLLRHPGFFTGARVALPAISGTAYTTELLAIWMAGGIAVPINPKHPMPALSHQIRDSGSIILLTFSDLKQYHSLSIKLEIDLVVVVRDQKDQQLPTITDTDPALIIYTSGTTSLPKGVLLTHANLKAQAECLSESWKWRPSDSILNVLPMHHVHGIINVLYCALWNGACCYFLNEFNPEKVRERFVSGEINLFMAVPTIYFKLIEYWKNLTPNEQRVWSRSMSSFRLMVSGSAALPEIIHRQWEEISGQRLLERYGMSETGMILSNPYRGERRAGFVGQPLPGVEVKVMKSSGNQSASDTSGELWVRGPSVFEKYWEKPDITADSFENGWFKTGDMVVVEQGYYRILGRKNIDIIKTGGYKVSALEIENVLLGHSHVKECAVVGRPSEEWGEVVVACVVCREEPPGKQELIDWVKESLANYKKPREIVFMDSLPRNALGKVIKSELKKEDLPK
jgi:malonyl-CoA/methylmalonyl-CoA synthetase